MNAAICDRTLKLEHFWPEKFEFTMIKEGFLEAWVNTYSQIAEEYCHCTPKYNDKAQEVIELILWLLKSLTKLRKNLLVDWHWDNTSLSVFDKNIKEISKGLKVNDIEIDEICKVIKEGTENFKKAVNPCSKKAAEKSESFKKCIENLEAYVMFLDNVRTGLKDGIKEAMKYLADEEKRLR